MPDTYADTPYSDDPDAGMSLAEAIEYIAGRAVLCEVAKRLGGRRLFIPKKCRPGNPLAAIIGDDAMAELIELIGGCTYVTVPYLKHFRRCLQVEDLVKDGKSSAQIAEIVGLHLRTVIRMQKKLKHGEVTPIRRRPNRGRRRTETASRYGLQPAHRFNAEALRSVERLTKQGRSRQQIAVALQTTLRQVSYARVALRKLGRLPDTGSRR